MLLLSSCLQRSLCFQSVLVTSDSLFSAHTVLVEEQDVAASKVDGMSSTEAGHYSLISHSAWRMVLGGFCLHPPPTTMTLGAIFGVCSNVVGYVNIMSVGGRKEEYKEEGGNLFVGSGV